MTINHQFSDVAARYGGEVGTDSAVGST